MEFKDKYCSITEKDKIENKDKIVLSNDFYAIGELLEKLKNQLENIRISGLLK